MLLKRKSVFSFIFSTYRIKCRIILKNLKIIGSSFIAVRNFSSQSADNGKSKDQAEENYEENIRNKILEASLPYINNLGWSKAALSAGAESVGYPGITHSMFPNGAGDLVHYFQKKSNKQLFQYLIKLQKETSETPILPLNFVEKALKERLQMTIPYISKWPQALAIMSLPQNVPNSLATLLTMVDDICYYAGDSSVDMNWYARRVAVAGVYKATELYLIQDTSPDYKSTWIFLKRRLEDLNQLHKLLTKSSETNHSAKDAITAAFTTARNMIGLN